MGKQRQKLISPVTILKTQQFLKTVKTQVSNGANISLDKLARDARISGSNGTALIRLKMLSYKDGVKGNFIINPSFGTDEKTAKIIIEDVRAHNVKYANRLTPEMVDKMNRKVPTEDQNDLDDPMAAKLDESLKSQQYASMLAKALKQAMPSHQGSLFDGQNSDHRDLVKIACSLSNAVYSRVGLNMNNGNPDRHQYEKINEAVVIVAKDLLSKLKA